VTVKKQLNSAGLLIIGDELLQGRRNDKHLSHTLGYFQEVGVELDWVYYLGDDHRTLVDHFSRIHERKNICFSFGGIGATPDDRTRRAMAEAHEREMVRHPEAVRLIEHQFGEGAYPNRIRMADLPEEAELIPNPFNNIPGFSLGTIHCLPGFPEMAWAMLEWVVQTIYDVSGNPRQHLVSFLVHGARESELIPLLEHAQERHPDVKLSSLPRFLKEGSFQVELGARGPRTAVQDAARFLRDQVTGLGFTIDQAGS
jgi:molybdopterin-biosynthesis enzyme MoeA-like protein